MLADEARHINVARFNGAAIRRDSGQEHWKIQGDVEGGEKERQKEIKSHLGPLLS